MTPHPDRSSEPLVLTDSGEPYAEDWVYIEVCERVSTVADARAWAEGAFLSEDEERPADGCPVARVWLRPRDPEHEPEEPEWTTTSRDDPDAREFWEIDVSHA